MPEQDAKIYAKMKLGDKQALEELYDRYVKLLYSFSYKMLQDKHTSEEIVQEIFVKIWTQKSSYDETKGKFSSWLLTITRHAIIDYMRKKKELVSDMTARELQPDSEQSVEDQIEWKEKREYIKEALNQLKEEQKLVIDLFYFKGLSQQKIADHCRIPLGTVKGRLRLALKHLKGKMQLSEQGKGGSI
ncbi:RNA polymerase sigma factor [Alkalihalobacillus trypoxylicola]|uniref:RNA polymerase subunit sigma-70 n=1 Tax=Alkalihalobacillus trypoxylicola TaxID=519424 RepID=A0A161PAJ2_9BACI|nr:sigma-70 family RNA polymerase sigma factor [Alkalihalobacillus trypoxylicola]KYG28251.1 RNA polymerase subunit sigma-70 [Alkalihalobacillus trypoxylicola]